jgi:hypothetical protein
VRQLHPTRLDPVDPLDVYGDPPRAGPGGRPGVRLNMIASVDGATTLGGVSGGWAARPTTTCSWRCGRSPTWCDAPTLELCSACEQDGFLFLRYRSS